MNVLHVTSGRLFGGVERTLVTIAACRAMTPGVEPTFAVGAPGRLHQELMQSGASVDLLGDVRLRRPQSVVTARARLRVILRARRPDVLICHTPWSYALFAPVGRREGARVALWQHDRASGRPLLERMCRGTPAEVVICNSRWTASSTHLIQPHAPVHVVHCPVLTSALHDGDRLAVRRAFDTSVNDVVVLIASRMEAWKGHERLLQALSRLQRLLTWTLWIAGGAQRAPEQRYRKRIERQAQKLSIGSRVRFLGEQSDVARVMRAADILCQPNRAPEPFGVVFVEAMMCGLPVITTASGGAPEVVTDDVGRLVREGRSNELDEALIELIGDSGLRSRLGVAGRARAEILCAPSRVLPQFERLLQSVVRVAAA